MLLAIVVLCVAAMPCSLGQKVHEQMSAKQVAQIFQTTHDSVPEYAVVQLHAPRLNKRAVSGLRKLEATLLGDQIKLWLQTNQGVLAGRNTPVFIAKKDPQTPNIIYKEVPAAMLNLGLVLEDPVEKATLVARTDARGQYIFDGFIGSRNLVVRSLPQSISNDLLRNTSSHNSKSWKNSQSAYHVVFKRKVIASATPLKKSKLANRGTIDLSAKRTTFARPIIPEVVYPECMVVVDYSLFKMHDYNVENVLMYILAFWNGVDLRYRSLDQPKFRFNIPRIVIATEEEATPYLSQHMYSPVLIDAYPANKAAKHYFYSINNIFPTTSYDAIVIMTGIRMADHNRHSRLLGLAQEGGVCVVDHKRKLVDSVALTYDDGAFYGVATVAHEFGHLLGAAHDAEVGCMPADGYMMAATSTKTENSQDFSQCTIRAIEKLLRRNGGSCLYNEPKGSISLPRYLPGMLTSRDRQCQKMGHGPSCYDPSKTQSRCSAVYCYKKRTPKVCYRFKIRTTLDGAFCDDGKVCLHGKCIRLTEGNASTEDV